MGLILDTSAVIAWLEHSDQDVVGAISRGGEVPFVHVVTLGELHEGVERARDRDPSVLVARRSTLDFVRRELRLAPAPDEDEAGAFGVLSAAVGRGLSHNNKWIVARTIIDRHRLVTRDRTLADAASSSELTHALNRAGLPPVEVTG